MNNLDAHSVAIKSSIRSFIQISLLPAQKLKAWQSKFGGRPFLPKGTTYPVNSEGKPLFLLAQINFEEAPHLYPYPEKGLLQFYISDDDMYGLDFSNPCRQDPFKVIYYPEIDIKNLQTDFSALPQMEHSPISGDAEYALQFQLKEMPVSVFDYRFVKTFENKVDDEFWDAYNRNYPAGGHKLGGYPSFTQQDPRETIENKDYLLLQMDTDEENGIMWGDNGVANFFISEKDLKNKDFSNVLYHWDCF
jgi:uncharacterized protein YwqG